MRDAISAAIMTVFLRSKLTETEFAERLGINRSEVIRWLNGQNIPSAKYISRLKDEFFHLMDWDWFIDLYRRDDLK